jgi:hypothetical protein
MILIGVGSPSDARLNYECALKRKEKIPRRSFAFREKLTKRTCNGFLFGFFGTMLCLRLETAIPRVTI